VNRFEELITAVSAKPETVVHLGAGQCRHHDYLAALGTERMIFVDADARHLETASRKSGESSRVQYLPMAIAAKKGQQTLHVTSNRQFSSLRLPSGLMEHYPNIEVVEELEVETRTLEGLCRDLGLDKPGNHLLIADIPGAEVEVFSQAEAGTLRLFRWILIRSSRFDLYEGSDDFSVEGFTDRLLQAGFNILTFEEDAPPFLDMLCVRNDAALECVRLRDHAAELESSLASASRALSASESQRHSIENELADLAQRIGELDSEREKQAQRTKKLISDKRRQSRQIKKLTEALEKKLEETEELQRTLKINNKLMLKSEADLRDLQLQYRNAIQGQDEQNTLFRELREKLGQAADYFRELDLPDRILEGDVMDPQDYEESDSSDSGAIGGSSEQ
jgi:FkbM family methyltransferase